VSWALHPLTEEQSEVQKLAREFERAEIAPHSSDWDQRAYFEPSLVKKLGELGFLGMMLPEEYDGLGTDTGTYLIALEEIAAADASVAVLMSVHNSLPTQMILRYGSDEQKSRFLKKMARGEILGALLCPSPTQDRTPPR
jgi:alkylation response protein AidB-like acyl-CoA dehydrogenase